jgi:PPOX class probable F420-dependent enzyme
MPDTNTSLLPDPVAAFLAGLHVASVASVDPDGAPWQAVAWYRLEPDGRILLNSRTPRRWCANLVRDPRVSLAIPDVADPYRWVGITGMVDEVVEDLDRARDDIVALAHRYHPEGVDPAQVATFRSQQRVTFLVRVTRVHDNLEG